MDVQFDGVFIGTKPMETPQVGFAITQEPAGLVARIVPRLTDDSEWTIIARLMKISGEAIGAVLLPAKTWAEAIDFMLEALQPRYGLRMPEFHFRVGGVLLIVREVRVLSKAEMSPRNSGSAEETGRLYVIDLTTPDIEAASAYALALGERPELCLGANVQRNRKSGLYTVLISLAPQAEERDIAKVLTEIVQAMYNDA